MGSIIFAKKCPCCGRSAVEDLDYNTSEFYIFCSRCGYNHSKIIKSYTQKTVEYEEEENVGHGVFLLVMNNGAHEITYLDCPVTEDVLKGLYKSFEDDNVNKEKSYLVLYENGEFSVLLGNPPKNFHLSFEEYKEKMFAKYGVPEYDFFVPIEE